MFTALPAIAFLFVLGSLLAIGHRDSSARDRERESFEAASAVARNARGYLDDRFDVMGTVGVLGDRRGSVLADAAKAGGFDSLGVIDARGVTLASSVSGGKGVDLSDRVYIREALAGRPTVSDVLDSRVSRRPVLAFAFPVVGGGAIGAGLNLDDVGRSLRRLLFNAVSGQTTIIDSAGNVVVGARPVDGLVPAPQGYPLARMRRTGEGVLSRAETERGDRVLSYETIQGTSWLAVVDRKRSDVIGPLDRALAAELGALALFAVFGVLLTLGIARRLDRLDRAREDALSEQREIALTLQESLLPELQPPPGLQAFAQYVPAQGAVAVGGDWYDVVDSHDGFVAVSVGDVAGHGLQAAATMGKLRSAARTLALESPAPADALSGLDRFAGSLADPPLATFAYASLHVESGELRYALAGHPPPLLLRADGSHELLEAGRSPLLGVPPMGPRPEGRTTLAPGDTLLIYTDGLVERPDASIDAGMAALADRAARMTDDLERMPERLLATVTEPRRDDAAVLVVRLAAVRELATT